MKVYHSFISILFALTATLFTLNSFSQANVQWQWKNDYNVTFADIAYQNGFIYAVGQFTAPSVTLGATTLINNGGTDLCVVKFDTSGNVIWASGYGNASNETITNLAVDNFGNIVFTGSFANTLIIGGNTLISAGGNDIFVVKLDGNGNVLFAKRAGGAAGSDFGKDICIDNVGSIYVFAESSGMTFGGSTCPVGARAILKYDNLGNEKKMRWLVGQTGNYPACQYISAVASKYSSSDNSIVVGGNFGYGNMIYSAGLQQYTYNLGVSNQDIYLVKVDTALNLLYMQNVTGNLNKTNTLTDICIRNNGLVYCAQAFSFSLNGYSYNYWAEYTPSFAYSSTKNLINSQLEFQPGSPRKMALQDSIIYGVIYQPEGPYPCTDYYAGQWNLNTNQFTYINLDTNHEYSPVAGFKGKYFLGDQTGIGKTCIANCPQMPNVLNPAPDIHFCPNDFAIIGSPCYFFNNAGITYSWLPVTGLNNASIAQPTVSGLPAGTVMNYTLTATDLNNNVFSDTVQVTVDSTPPPVTIIPQFPVICDSMQLTVSPSIPGTWLYFPMAPANWTQQYLTGNSASVMIYAPGYYIYHKFQCGVVSIDTFFVPGMFSVTANATDDTICLGQSTTLYGSGAVSYTWTGGIQNNVSFAPNVSAYYSVLGTDANGCVSNSSIYIKVNPNSSSYSSAVLCSNQAPYNWQGQQLFSSGVYKDTIPNVYGCDSILTLNLSVSPCTVCVANYTIVNSPYLIELTESQTWIKSSGTVVIPAGKVVRLDADQTSYVLLEPGFKVDSGALFVAKAYNGCSYGQPNLPIGKVYRGDEKTTAEIVLYPNPTTGLIHIQHDEKLSNIMIFDMVGKLVVNQKCNGETETNIDLSNLPNGVYHVKAAGFNAIKVIKN